jgi:hypothetical protein
MLVILIGARQWRIAMPAIAGGGEAGPPAPSAMIDPMPLDARQHSPAAERNRQPLLDLLQRWLPTHGHALEIASGTGQHAVAFAAGLPGWTWQPSDLQPAALASISAWVADAALPNLQPPVMLDVTAPVWTVGGPVDTIFAANLVHIAPWPACLGLMAGAARHLAAHGNLVLYGPYRVQGETTAPSNEAFDADLRQRDPRWGLRWLHEIVAAAATEGLVLRDRAALPANNQALRFTRA